MLYINNDDKLTAAEVRVVEHYEVQGLVGEGWRILGMVHSTTQGAPPLEQAYSIDGYVGSSDNNFDGSVKMPGWPSAPIQTPLFIMGRDGAAADLQVRLLTAKEEAKASGDLATKAIEQLGEAQAAAVRDKEGWITRVDALQAEATIARDTAQASQTRIAVLEAEKAVVRKEIGEARWRDILGAVEVEETLLEAPKDDDMPF